MWVSMCVALWEVWGHKTVEGGLQYLVKKTKFASKNVPIFFCSWAQHVGVRIIFFKCALNDYFSILISIKSVLQLFLFLFFFINAGPLLVLSSSRKCWSVCFPEERQRNKSACAHPEAAKARCGYL